MNKTYSNTEDISVVLDLEVLKNLHFLNTFVERNASLKQSGVYLDFNKGEGYIKKLQTAESTQAGLLNFKFEVHEGFEILKDYVLLIPTHKVVQVLKWNEASTLTFNISKQGEVKVKVNNSIIQLAVEWLKPFDNTYNIFTDYKGGVLECIEAFYTQVPTFVLNSTEASTVLDDAIDIAKINDSLAYVSGKCFEGSGSGSIDTDYILGYGRTSLLFVDNNKLASRALPQIRHKDSSVSLSYLQNIKNILKSFSKVSAGVFEIKLVIHENEDIRVLHIEAWDETACKVKILLDIPSASEKGMAPPSEEELKAILGMTALYIEDSSTISLDYPELIETLDLWDSLQRVDGKDLITPLKPVSFVYSEALNKVELSISSQDGMNSAEFTAIENIHAEAFDVARVPFEQFHSALSNPLLLETSKDDAPLISLKRPNTEDPSFISVERNDSILVLAEFV